MAITVERKYIEIVKQELREKFPVWAKDNGRLERGVEIAATGGVERLGHSLFRVRSQHAAWRGPYLVDSAALTCECADYIHRTAMLDKPQKCKHRIAVYIATRAAELQRRAREIEQFLYEECDKSPRAVQIDARGLWERCGGAFWSHSCADGLIMPAENLRDHGEGVFCPRCEQNAPSSLA